MTHVDVEAALRHDDNIGRGEQSGDVFSDNIADLGLNVAHIMMLSPGSGLRLRGGLHIEQHARFDDLDLLSASIGASYRIQPVAGYTLPWFELGTSVERLSFRNSDIRDGWVNNIQATLGKNFTDRLSGRIGVVREWRNADEEGDKRWPTAYWGGSIFDWQHNKLFAMANYKFGMESTLYATLTRIYGDQVFTAAPNLIAWSKTSAIADDPAFGTRRAYRMGAISDLIELGVNTPLTASTTLDVGARHFYADADSGHEYDSTELRASLLYRFR